MPRPKKITEPVVEQQTQMSSSATLPESFKMPDGVVEPGNSTSNQQVKVVEKIEINKEDWDKLQEQIKMLTAVADKGRLFNYESQQSTQKKPMKVKISVYNDQYIIGWKTIKDELVKHPTTGVTVGELQEYEVSLLSKDGVASTIKIIGYPAFSDARYTNRVECEVINKTEDYNGNLEFEINLPEGQKVKLNSRFIN